MDDLKIYEEIIRLDRSGCPSALATVVENAGSSPRKAGAKMLVKTDGSILGTIGGGKVELDVIAAAREVMASGLPRTMKFTLTQEHGHVCGGNLLIYIEPNAVRPRLLVIGAGHVGRAVATAAKFAGFKVTVADERPEYATTEQVPDADFVMVADYDGLAARAVVDGSTFIVITTTGFEKDFAAVRAALSTPARYIGVIGSARKRETLVRTLTEEGYSRETVGRVIIPVGLDINAETPAEIAVSIVAQLIQARRNRAASDVSDTAGGRNVASDGMPQAAPAPR